MAAIEAQRSRVAPARAQDRDGLFQRVEAPPGVSGGAPFACAASRKPPPPSPASKRPPLSRSSVAAAIDNHAIVGLVVFGVFAASTVGQASLERISASVALAAGPAALIAGMGLVALALAVSSLALLVAGGLVAGFGQGMSFRAV